MDSADWIHHTCQSQWVTFLNHNKKCHRAFRIFIRNSRHPEFNISLTLSGLDLTRARVKDVKNTHFQVRVRYQGSQPDTILHHIWLWLCSLSASSYSKQQGDQPLKLLGTCLISSLEVCHFCRTCLSDIKRDRILKIFTQVHLNFSDWDEGWKVWWVYGFVWPDKGCHKLSKS